MNAIWRYLDGLPPGPVALFLAGWLVFLVTVLAGFRRGRDVELCDRCGKPWEQTARGGQVHLCAPSRDRAYL